MAYLSRDILESMGFSRLGKNVKISEKASIYEPEKMEIGDHSRIDDFCVVSGKIAMGRNVYIGPFCLVAGGTPGITFEDFTTLAYHAQVFSQSDDYSGVTMANPTVPAAYKSETKEAVHLMCHSIVGGPEELSAPALCSQRAPQSVWEGSSCALQSRGRSM